MAAFLYALTALALLAAVHRLIIRIDRRFGLVLILLPLVITGRALLTGAVYAPVDLAFTSFPLHAMSEEYGVEQVQNPALSDLYAQIIPWKKAVRDAWLGGEWPLWNPYQFAGDILAASSQPAPYDPLLLLSLLLPMAQSLTFLASMTLFLYGLWMFVWLREIGSSQRASIFGAAAWMFGSFVLFWLAWPMAATIAWLPLVLTGARRVLNDARNGTALLTAAFTLMLLAGHPESAMHIVAIAGVVTVWQLALTRSFPLAKLGRLCAAGILALLLTAIYLLPIIEAIPQTVEHFHREQLYAKTPRALPPSEAGAQLATNFVPFLYGAQHEETATTAPPYISPATAYAGSLLFPLALFGLRRSKRGQRWLFAALASAGLLIGADFPLLANL
ncbi:MAG: hypothetical protein KY432_10875, partial [Acidobacteria bacterium]|nr:hypothetical protein [Acidobacteriota bacterium]